MYLNREAKEDEEAKESDAKNKAAEGAKKEE